MTRKAFIHCENVRGAFVYRPVRTSEVGALVCLHDENDGTRAHADRVVDEYNNGCGDDVRAATWDRDHGCWEVTEYDTRGGSGHRGEDFHSDEGL